MSSPYFTALGPVTSAGSSPSSDGLPGLGTVAAQRFAANEACVGPWSEQACHGGPPSALLVRSCEQVAATAGLVAIRTSVDFLAPVPVGELDVRARVVRAGRRIMLAEAILAAGDRDVLHARTWLVATSSLPALAPDPATQAPLAPRPQDLAAAMDSWTFPYARSIQWRHVSGDPHGAGDAAVWGRPLLSLVDGEPMSGLQRAVLVADSGNGVSASLDWNRWLFVNIDLDVHLSRPLLGDWVLLDATSRYQPTGTGLATSVLSDLDGVVGAGAQTLVVSPR